MMKKLAIIVLYLVIFQESLLVYADCGNICKNNTLLELGIVNNSSFSNLDFVTREEGITTIMKVIGVTDREVGLLDGADLNTFVDTAPYSYVGCAYVGKIAYGEECVVDYPTYRTLHTGKNTDFFFFPEHKITLSETLAFIVRCLENDKGDLNATFEKAKEYGLINDDDDFIQEFDSTIAPNVFCTLIERMLHQKRYKYYDRVNNMFKMEGNIDKERSITYLEFLKQRNLMEK